MYFFDWTFIIIIPGLLLSLWAQSKVKSAFNQYSKIYSAQGYSAERIARDLLNQDHLYDVNIEPVSGELTDNYNPKTRTLYLSQNVYGSASIAAIGVAAHETGHAIQHHREYRPLVVRSFIYPVVNIGSSLSWPIFLFGLIFSIPILLKIGILAFGLAVVFSLITLPVEFNASKRALALLSSENYLTSDELMGAKKVLDAAALTYVASALSAMLQLLRLILLSRRR